MYSPRGFGLSEVGDVEVFPDGDRIHLFHLTLPNHDTVQHVVSTDGLAWKTLPDALRTGEPGECDDDMIWTMSVTQREQIYFMVYTALARAENGQVQRTALATSTDLIHWTKSRANPVGEADPRWYESETTGAGSVSWRDPKPILVGDTYYAAVCAREKAGPPMRRGCIGLLATRDLLSWEARPPLFAPRRYWDLECPQVFAIDGAYYATAAVMEDRTQRYWSAPAFEGPYDVPADGGILAPRGHYAGRVCAWQGLTLYFCWHKAEYDWSGFRNPAGKFVPSPLVLFRRPDGSLGRRSFPGWEKYRIAPATRVERASESLFQQRRNDSGDDWRVEANGRMDLVASAADVEDMVWEGTLQLDARAGGLGFRLDALGGGYFIDLQVGSNEVTLKKWLPTKAEGDGRPWFKYAELQRGILPRAIKWGEAIPFKLLTVGPYVECSLDGEVVLATATAERTSGRFGIWAESGTAVGSDLSWSAMRRPEHGTAG
jgi:beta-fructofuranosidase